MAEAEPARGGPRTTALGPVAESYDQLHRIDLLARARAGGGVAPASYESLVRAVFQAAEVSLRNLSRLAERTRAGTLAGELGDTARFSRWSIGFHRLLRHLGTALFDARSVFGQGDLAGTSEIGLAESAGYRAYVEAVRGLEQAVRTALLERDQKAVRSTIATRSIDDPLYSFLHDLRTGSHDATKWESDLSGVRVRKPVGQTLDEFTRAALLAEAVAATELHGATLHGEFVALHQIPELLCAEANDHLEAAVRALRAADLSRAVEHLAACRALLVPVVEAQRVMAELLATGEYHGFRENLGPASGTHSLAIKQHMFRDLFKCFWGDLESWLLSFHQGSLSDAVRSVDEGRHKDPELWLRHSVIDHAFRLHFVHQQWRHEHLHMPRNCLGSGGTKSMIGIPDGPQAVYKMRDAANAQRSLVAIHAARGVRLSNSVPDSPLNRLVAGPASVDAELMRLVGEATREYFPDVQEQSYKPFHSGAAERKP
ncbi:hypothetical protein ACFXPX_40530 [Kitasatospora sp. NPDC059146]|uniref:hypothetical protein n=1 Tax=unclassified Kitasatospora TaxID=2633591 RepID=UPI00367FCE8B